jgi:hypothetical protein
MAILLALGAEALPGGTISGISSSFWTHVPRWNCPTVVNRFPRPLQPQPTHATTPWNRVVSTWMAAAAAAAGGGGGGVSGAPALHAGTPRRQRQDLQVLLAVRHTATDSAPHARRRVKAAAAAAAAAQLALGSSSQASNSAQRRAPRAQLLTCSASWIHRRRIGLR